MIAKMKRGKKVAKFEWKRAKMIELPTNDKVGNPSE